MMKKMKSACLLVCIVLCICLALPRSARANGESRDAQAFIVGKGPDVVILGAHGFNNLPTNRLDVVPTPVIYDTDGTILSLRHLKIPCQAYVAYKKAVDSPMKIFRIEVRGYGKNAAAENTEPVTSPAFAE